MGSVSNVSEFLDDLHDVNLFLNLFPCFIHASLGSIFLTAMTAAKTLLARYLAYEVLKKIVVLCVIDKIGPLKVLFAIIQLVV